MLLDLRYVAESTMEDVPIPEVGLEILDLQGVGHLGPGTAANLMLHEGQVVTFVLRCPPKDPPIPQAIPKTSTANEYSVPFECMPCDLLITISEILPSDHRGSQQASRQG